MHCTGCCAQLRVPLQFGAPQSQRTLSPASSLNLQVHEKRSSLVSMARCSWLLVLLLDHVHMQFPIKKHSRESLVTSLHLLSARTHEPCSTALDLCLNCWQPVGIQNRIHANSLADEAIGFELHRNKMTVFGCMRACPAHVQHTGRKPSPWRCLSLCTRCTPSQPVVHHTCSQM